MRDRVWPDYSGADKNAAFYTLFVVTETITKLLAPFCPYLAENVHQDVIKPLSKKAKESVHMEDWPKADKKLMNEKLEKQMNIVKQLVELSYAARHTAGIKLRWPVNSVVAVSKKDEVATAVRTLKEILKYMCNAKNVVAKTKEPAGEFSKTESIFATVFVETKMDNKLLNEALFRELVRKVQSMRKKNKFKVSDRITLTLLSDEKTNKFLKRKQKELMKEVGAKKIGIGKITGRRIGKLKFKNTDVDIGFE